MQLEARLRAFAAVARQGSVSRAASELFVSQPAVSKHLAALESELGTALVERRRNGARLTPAGRVLADYALRAEALLATARRAIEALDDEEAGTVRVAASGIPADYVLPRLLPRFGARYPRITVDVRATTSAGALSLVRAHEVELAVVGCFTAPSDLEAEPLLDDDIVLVGRPDVARRRLRRSDLERETWVTREEGSSTSAAVEAARWQLGLEEVRRLEAPSWSAVKELVVAGAGIAAISRMAIEHELAAGALAILDVPRWRLRRTISVVAAREVPLTPAAARFRDALVAFGRASSADGEDPDAGGDGLRRAELVASLMAEASIHLGGVQHDDWAARLDEQRVEVDTAVATAAAAGDWELVVRLLGPCWRHWVREDYPPAWRQALGRALESVPDELQLDALPTLGWLAFSDGDREAATSYANRRLELARGLRRDGDAAGALNILAAIAIERSEYDEAR
jgi:DNA-binding transcriptional LysR family regulator